MASLIQIADALQSLVCEGEKPSIYPAIAALRDIKTALDGLTVQGRNNVDVLLGCMMCIDQIIGEESTDGR